MDLIICYMRILCETVGKEAFPDTGKRCKQEGHLVKYCFTG